MERNRKVCFSTDDYDGVGGVFGTLFPAMTTALVDGLKRFSSYRQCAGDTLARRFFLYDRMVSL